MRYFEVQLNKSQLEYKAIKHYNYEVNMRCNGGDAPGDYEHSIEIYLYNPYW